MQRMLDPKQTEELLEAFARAHNLVPADASRIKSPAELTRPMRRLITLAEATGIRWLAWSSKLRLLLLMGAPSLDLSRERGCPVLQVQVFDEEGTLLDSCNCLRTTEGKLERCPLS
jgi:hypothetical protein